MDYSLKMLEESLEKGQSLVEKGEGGYSLYIESLDSKLSLTTGNGISYSLSYLGYEVFDMETELSLANRQIEKNRLIERKVLDENLELNIDLPEEIKTVINNYSKAEPRWTSKINEKDERKVAKAVKELNGYKTSEQIAGKTEDLNRGHVGFILNRWMEKYGLDEQKFTRKSNQRNYCLPQIKNNEKGFNVVDEILEE